MKTIQKIIVSHLILFGMSYCIYAQQKKIDPPQFQGTLKLINNVACVGDTIFFGYRKPYMPAGTNQEEVSLITDKTGKFSFNLPEFDIPVSMIMAINHKGKFIRIYGIDRFFFETGDKIKIEIVLGMNAEIISVKFSGQGSEKYNVSIQCSKIAGSADGELMDSYLTMDRNNNFENPRNLENKLLLYTEMVRGMIKKQQNIINLSSLNSDIKKMISYQYSRAFTEWMFRMNIYYLSYKNKKDSVAMKVVSKVYQNNLDYFVDPYPQNNLMAICSSYLWEQAIRDSFSLINMNDKKPVVQDIYELFKKKYSGQTRELLIANMFIAGHGINMPIQPEIIDSLMKDGEKYITIPTISEVYKSKLKLLRNMDVYNGSFKDINNNDISIASLKGKVVFIDIWGTGCSACARFHQIFHKDVFPIFKNNKDFIYLSISGDKTKEVYIKSVNSGRYTSNCYLNVFMKDLGLRNHPFSKYYNIGATPFLLLVDKNGKVYTSSLSNDSKQLINLIDKALTVPLIQSK